MKTLAALLALAGGALLLVVPRFVFPACEYLGRGRMHCTDAAHAEFVVGGLLAAAGVCLLALRPGWPAFAAAAVAAALCVAAALVPAYTGYCANPDMACRYGMVPTVRFVAGVVGLAQVAAAAGLARGAARGGDS